MLHPARFFESNENKIPRTLLPGRPKLTWQFRGARVSVSSPCLGCLCNKRCAMACFLCFPILKPRCLSFRIRRRHQSMCGRKYPTYVHMSVLSTGTGHTRPRGLRARTSTTSDSTSNTRGSGSSRRSSARRTPRLLTTPGRGVAPVSCLRAVTFVSLCLIVFFLFPCLVFFLVLWCTAQQPSETSCVAGA